MRDEADGERRRAIRYERREPYQRRVPVIKMIKKEEHELKIEIK